MLFRSHKAVELTRTMACELVFWHTLEATSVRGSRETILEAYREVRNSLTRRIEQALGPFAHASAGVPAEVP